MCSSITVYGTQGTNFGSLSAAIIELVDWQCNSVYLHIYIVYNTVLLLINILYYVAKGQIYIGKLYI